VQFALVIYRQVGVTWKQASPAAVNNQAYDCAMHLRPIHQEATRAEQRPGLLEKAEGSACNHAWSGSAQLKASSRVDGVQQLLA
jgi:hypothetical protein